MGLKITDYSAQIAAGATYEKMPVPFRYIVKCPKVDVKLNLVEDNNIGEWPRPTNSEQWRFGFVQNVLFDACEVDFADKSAPAKIRWSSPALDSTSKLFAPFYGPFMPPGMQPAPTRPMVYGKDGLSEIQINPKKLELDAYSISKPISKIEFSFNDQPTATIRGRGPTGASVISVKRAIILQWWFIAITPRSTVNVLLSQQPGTFYVEARMQPLSPIQEVMTEPEYEAAYLWLPERVTDLARLSRQANSTRPPGNATNRYFLNPKHEHIVMDGMLANQRDVEWFKVSGLAPNAAWGSP